MLNCRHHDSGALGRSRPDPEPSRATPNYAKLGQTTPKEANHRIAEIVSNEGYKKSLFSSLVTEIVNNELYF